MKHSSTMKRFLIGTLGALLFSCQGAPDERAVVFKLRTGK